MSLLCRIRWAWQRLYRGWDDRVIWNVDIYLARMLPIWLGVLRDSKLGVPANLCTKSVDYGAVIWEGVLDKIINGFIAAQHIAEIDFPILDDLRSLEKRRYGRILRPWIDEEYAQSKQLQKELDFGPELKRQEGVAYKEFQEGMDLFKEYFFSLWS